MGARMDLAVNKTCDGVDPTSVQVWCDRCRCVVWARGKNTKVRLKINVVAGVSLIIEVPPSPLV